ncbi:PAS domain-containing protein [Geomonas sp. RF6]|uniref:PAS domain-containing protein n=1 Tax=Geomonas sp. RF6 TaxID=2897342 RepID=UPI001E2D3DA2|nr:PAS domain-containing protein [Geomonas sp. RF6]UFS69760.1 PAS domain-containing protein [Geomonas sp. RF6]
MVLPVLSVLLVDGDVAEVERLREMLAATPFVLDVANNLSEALRALHSGRTFDAMIVDLTLPDSLGIETALALRSVNRTAALLVLTFQDDDQALQSLQLDIQDYLVKEELTGSLLTRSIRYAVQRKKDALAQQMAQRTCEELLLQLQSVLENIAEGVVIADAGGMILHMNREALSFYQCNYAEARRPLAELQQVFELYDLEGRPVPYEMWPMVRALRGERFKGQDVEVRRKDSGQTWFRSFSGTPVLGERGEVVLGVMTLRDITEKTHIERALRATQAQLQVVTETMPVGVALCSRDRRYVWVSPEYARWHGLSPEEIAGHDIREIVGDEAYEVLAPHLDQVLTGQPVVYEAGVQFRGIGYRWVSGRCMPVYDTAGVLDGWVAVVFDNTKHWETEEELQRSRQMLHETVSEREAELSATVTQLQAETEKRVRALEELQGKEQMLIQQSRMAAMGEMIGFIAHQWRQPLNILGLILQDFTVAYRSGTFSAELLEESTKRGLELIGHMSRTIEDFRSFFRTDKEKDRFLLKDALEQTLAMVKSSLGQHGIEIEVAVEDDPVAEGFANEFSQVLINILMNARDAFVARQTPKPRITVRVFAEGEKQVVALSDNAGGIAPEIIGSIFEPYFTTKKPDEGTGLGLYMAKTIIEKKMGGKLCVQNCGEGAEFRIELGPAGEGVCGGCRSGSPGDDEAG